MISRIWHGYTTKKNADIYENLLRSEIFDGIRNRNIKGYKGIQLLRRELEDETEFITIMWFDSLDSVAEFAGTDYDQAVVPEKARKVLSRYDQVSQHYNVLVDDTQFNGHSFENVYGDQARAESYSRMEFPNTYYLAYRDLPKIISSHVKGVRAIDFGCGTGRSTRFLKQLGFEVTGIDISADMLKIAMQLDKGGDYRMVNDGNYTQLGNNQYDLVQSIFTFDNIPGWENRVNILKGLRDLLKPEGKIICLDSTPELYTNEWASFSTRDFPGNRDAKTGDIVYDIMLDVEDRRPVKDIFWTVEDYHKIFAKAGLILEETYKPLGLKSEPFEWKSELHTAPWMIFVLKK
ncbi:MAG: methyltransferase [Methanosarcina sp.]